MWFSSEFLFSRSRYTSPQQVTHLIGKDVDLVAQLSLISKSPSLWDVLLPLAYRQQFSVSPEKHMQATLGK